MPKTIGLPASTRRWIAKENRRLQPDPKVFEAYSKLKSLVGVTRFISDGHTVEWLLIGQYRSVVVA